ncbi:LPXTG cell wall anchor domain-containing protein [Erysipelothrix amsterdamensis]|uniref:LPXTG cell wall anchor domain-containing protein n=1 Tax=Erysipelothrix amsterdamensis TaxID=2929157 RepID=A0AAU9VHD1_9FIRM|nr:LPXTG cell wall anchor domain-containing protein [Erysipelothrix sp. A18Y020d]CAH2761227.1 LPXTG cell wall anchor domain-containing protein [Erysipelothrix sp. A18Y020d]
MNKMIQKLSLTLITAVLVSITFTAISADTTTVVEDVIIDQRFAHASGRVDSDFFYYEVVINNNGKNTERFDGYDFNANFSLKTAPEGRRLKYVTNSIDHVYYKKDWYGGDRKAATAMVWDNEEGQWKVPNPWVDIDGNPLSTVTPGNPNGIRLRMFDTGKGALALRPKSETPLPETGLSGPYQSLLNGGWNLKEISFNSKDNNVLAFDLYNNETNIVNNGKIFEMSQEKDESLWPHAHGAWHSFSFGNYVYYEVENDAKISYEPLAIEDTYELNDSVTLGTTASITAPVTFKLNYQWQVSADNEVFTDLENENEATLSLQATKDHDGAYYRLVIGVDRSSTEVTTNAVQLNVNKNILSFNTQLSDLESPESQIRYAQETIGTLPTLSHETHEFIGWTYDQEGLLPVKETDTLEHDTVLFAAWNRVHALELVVDANIEYKLGSICEETDFLRDINAHVRRSGSSRMLNQIQLVSNFDTSVNLSQLGQYEVTVSVAVSTTYLVSDQKVIVSIVEGDVETPTPSLPETETPIKPNPTPETKPEVKPNLPQGPTHIQSENTHEERIENGNITTSKNTVFVINDNSGLIQSNDAVDMNSLPNTGMNTTIKPFIGLGIVVVGIFMATRRRKD